MDPFARLSSNIQANSPSAVLSGTYLNILMRNAELYGGLRGDSIDPPTVLNVGTTKTLGGEEVTWDDARLDRLGGTWGLVGPGFPDNLMGYAQNLTYENLVKTGIGGSIEFDYTGTELEIRVKESGENAEFDMVVDGNLEASVTGISTAGNFPYFKFTWGASKLRHIRLEFYFEGRLLDMVSETGGTIAAPTRDKSDLKAIIIGDSFTEGAVAASPQLGWAVQCSRLLGVSDYHPSSFGGTGYQNTHDPGFGGVRGTFLNRIEDDCSDYSPDVVILAGGINDLSYGGFPTGFQTAVEDTIDGALVGTSVNDVYVLNLFNPDAPTIGVNEAIANQAIADAAMNKCVNLIDVSDFSFTKYDQPHPDTIGHLNIAKYVKSKILGTPFVREDNPDLIITVKSDNTGTSADNQFTLPFAGTSCDFTWSDSDGNSGTHTGSADKTFTFSSAGTYTIHINGTIPRIYFNNTGDKLKLLDISNWGDIEYSSMFKAFNGCQNMNVTATDAPKQADATISMLYAFRDCFVLDPPYGFGHWTIKPSSCDAVFYRAHAFNSPLTNWDMSECSNFGYMFNQAGSYNQDVSYWNISSATIATNIMSSSSFSTENYDKLLIGWNAQPHNLNVSLGVGATTYSAGAAATARASLAADGWTISDGGEA